MTSDYPYILLISQAFQLKGSIYIVNTISSIFIFIENLEILTILSIADGTLSVRTLRLTLRTTERIFVRFSLLRRAFLEYGLGMRLWEEFRVWMATIWGQKYKQEKIYGYSHEWSSSLRSCFVYNRCHGIHNKAASDVFSIRLATRQNHHDFAVWLSVLFHGPRNVYRVDETSENSVWILLKKITRMKSRTNK